MDELPNGRRAEPRPAAARRLVSEERGLARRLPCDLRHATLDEAGRSAEERSALSRAAALAAALSVGAE